MTKTFLRSTAALFMGALLIVSCSEDQEGFTTGEGTDSSLKMEELTNQLDAVQGASLEIPNQYIVVFNTDETGDIGQRFADYETAKTEVEKLASTILGKTDRSSLDIVHTYAKSINGLTLRLSPNELDLLRNDRRVLFVEQDRVVQFGPPCGTPNGGPCDPGGGGGGGSAQTTPWGITRVNGGVNYTGSNVAYILDSGIDLDHEDLNVNPALGFNAFTSGKDGQSLDDGNGHGTHVAGTIAAVNNDTGVIGVAAGATVVPVKVLDRRGSGSYSGVIAGVDFVGANGSSGDVANMSLGGPVSPALDAAVTGAAGVIKFFLAAGNEGQDANNSSPGRANGTGVYTISAMSQGDNWASFSNYGNPPVDYCAPGVSISSTWKNGGYNTISGTSMAAPHAAGIALLGQISSGGTVNGDPDGNADEISVH